MENEKMSLDEFAEIACAIDARIAYYEERIERAKEMKIDFGERYFKDVLNQLNTAKRKFWEESNCFVDVETEGENGKQKNEHE